MLRRILQMVSLWCDNVHRVAFCKLKRVVYLGRARPILVYVFYGGYAPFITQSVADGRGFCLFQQGFLVWKKKSVTPSDRSEHIKRSLCGIDTASHKC